MAELRKLIEEVDKLLLPGGDLDLAEERIETALKALSPSHSELERAMVYSLAARVKLELGRDYEEAEGYALKSFDLLKDTALHQERAKVQFCLGRIYVSLGNLEKARCFFEDSLSSYRLIGDTEGILDAVNGLSWVSFILSERDEAIKRLEYGLAESKRIDDPRRIALFSGNLGVAYLLASRWQEAEEKLNFGLKIYESIGDNIQIVRRSISLSRLYLRERRWSASSELILKAKQASQEHNFPREMAMSLESEGELNFDQGEYAEAEKSYLDGLKIGEQISPEGDVVAELCRKLADLYVATKKPDPDKAIEYGQRALRVSTKIGDRFEQGCCHRVLAVAHHLKGLRDRSQEEFAKAISVLRSIGDRFELANTLLAQGELSGRVDLLREARRLFAQIQGADFYQALAKMELAKVEPSFKSAVEHLRAAEKIFRARREGEKLKEVEALKVEFNGKLTQPTARKYEFLRGLSSPDLGEIFEVVIRELKADRGFVAYRTDISKGEIKIEGKHNLTKEETKKLLSHIADGNGLQPGEPFILYDAALDDSFSSLGAGSLMITPFGSNKEGRIDGYLYVDRQRNKEPFLDKEYDLFYSLSERVGRTIYQKRQEELEEELRELKRSLKGSGVITHNPQMLKVLEVIELAQGCDAPILLTGETGTGKDFIARIIHQGSARRDGGFVEIHCGAIPKDLVESELFGHEKGAFTGAISRKLGRLELAEGGTLFLNEIGELPESTQVKLLRFLDTNELERVGGNKTIRVNTRVIAATNKVLEAAVEKGAFRKDLYYRLNVLCVELPPLRERKEDIPLLAHHFIKLYGDKYGKKVQGMAPGVLRAMMEFDWPGNIRELENAIETMVIAAREGEKIGIELLPEEVKKLFQPEEAPTLPRKLASVEKEAICDALKRTNGIKTKAAQILGIHEATLRGKIKKYKLERVMDS